MATLDKRQLKTFYRRMKKLNDNDLFMKSLMRQITRAHKKLYGAELDDFETRLSAAVDNLKSQKPKKPNVQLFLSTQERMVREFKRLRDKGLSFKDVADLVTSKSYDHFLK